jgi:hypothetical protein
MGIVLLSLGSLLAPLHSLVGWFAPAARARTSPLQSPAAVHVTPRACARRPLRVVRVVEARQGACGAGRMVISGRMADVCAELDRLAALEAAAR